VCLCSAALLGVLFGLAVAPCAAAEPQPVPEYRVKLVFLYNFARFATWPKTAFESPKAPLDIGVLDMTPFSDVLDVIEGKRAGGRPIRVRLCRTVEEMKRCHVLFMNPGDDLYIKSILAALRDEPVLTVSENAAFTRWGGMIQFFTSERRIQFAVNRKAAKRAGIRLSSQLLQVARIDETEGER
jgi:hypothetical protein